MSLVIWTGAMVMEDMATGMVRDMVIVMDMAMVAIELMDMGIAMVSCMGWMVAMEAAMDMEGAMDMVGDMDMGIRGGIVTSVKNTLDFSSGQAQ